MGSTIRQRGKAGTWWYYGHWRGRRYRQSLQTTDHRDAEKEQRQLDARYDVTRDKQPRKGKDPRVTEIWSLDDDTGKYIEWLRAVERDPDTISIHRIFWAALLDEVPAQRLGQFTRDDFETVRRRRVRSGKWSKRTFNNFLTDVQAIINRCKREGWYTGTNPAEGVERYTVTQRESEPHTADDMEALLEAAIKVDKGSETGLHHTEWTILLGGFAGLRKLEIAHCRWEWLHFKGAKPMIRVKRHDGFEIKDRAERSFPMSKRIKAALQPHAKKSGFVFESGRASKGKHRYRFDNKTSVVAALEAAGLRTDDPFQRLRISFVCMHAAAGTSIFDVSKWCGHSSVKVTEQYYATAQGYKPSIDNV